MSEDDFLRWFSFISFWFVISLLASLVTVEACLSSRLFAMSSSSSSSMSSHGSILPIFVSFQSVCSCLSLSPPRISRLLFASPWVEMAPMRYFQQRCERLSRFSSANCNQRSGCAPPFLVGGSPLMPLASLSPSYRVHTSDLHTLQSCAATFHMERST